MVNRNQMKIIGMTAGDFNFLASEKKAALLDFIEQQSLLPSLSNITLDPLVGYEKIDCEKEYVATCKSKSSTKHGYSEKSIKKRRKNNKNKKTHRK